MDFIIDCHTHISDLQDLEEYTDKNKDDVFALTMRYPDFSQEHRVEFNQNIDALIADNRRIAVIEGIDINMDMTKQLAEIEANIEKRRIVGLKIYLGYQPIFADDAKLKPVYQFAKKHNLTIVYHCGVVASTEKVGTFYKHSSYLYPIDDIAVTYPEVKFVISHLGFPKLWDTAAIVMKNDNVFTDISGLFEDDSDFYALTNQVIHDLCSVQNYWGNLYAKVMYGTDYCGDDTPLKEIRAYLKIAKQAFDYDVLDDIFYNNAVKAYPRLEQYLKRADE